METIDVFLIFFGAVAALFVGANIWLSTKSGKRWLRDLN